MSVVAREWGVLSRNTGMAYMLAVTRDSAEFLQAATGRLDVFDVVQDVDGELVVYPTRPGASPIPEFARKPVDSVGENEEMVRLVLVLSDPLYGRKIPAMTVTAEEIRERAEGRHS